MTHRKLSLLAPAALAVLTVLLLVACSNGDPGLTRAQVQEIVREEMAEAPVPPRPEPALTSADVEEAIRATMAEMPQPDAGLSEEEVGQIVHTAMAAMPEPQPGLTSADVEEAIRAAMAEMPQPDAGLSEEEVGQIVHTAMAAMPEPQPGLTSAAAEKIARSVVASIPSRSNPIEYTRFFVERAVTKYETQGLDATLAYYNREESIDGQWYVFIVDDNDEVIAHPDGSLIGLDLKGPLGTDANGYEFGPEMLSAAEDGRWVSYVYRNPETRSIGAAFGELQLKNAWVVRHDGLLFGSGWYVDADEFTKSFVAAAVDKFRSVGLEATIAYFTGPESVY